VVSLDLSLKMLLMRKDSEDYRAVQGMSYELPFQSGVFDMVISIAALHHIAERINVKKTINEMKRVARKGGHIVLWDHNPYNPYWKVIMKKVPQDTGEERLIGIDELTEPFRTGGFSFEIYRKGFMPDFMPEKLAGLFRVFEALIEKIPLLNLFTAHNVIVARKL
jgi:ubiquinone/menaquinone biosynthesis C-methylase UbiE